MGLFKFVMRCAESNKRIHILSGLHQGTIEKTLSPMNWASWTTSAGWWNTGPAGAARTAWRIWCRTRPAGIRKIYVLGHADKAR